MKIIPYNEVSKLHLDPLCSINLDLFLFYVQSVDGEKQLGSWIRGICCSFVVCLFVCFWCLSKLLVVRKAGVQGSLEA